MASISLKEKIIGKLSEFMVSKSSQPPPITKVKKPLDISRIAFITTAGIHLKDQDGFNTDGDYSYRIIPGDVDFNNLTITHTHYDTSEALKDKNVVFPLEILRELESNNYIGEVAPRNFGLMGYMPDIDILINNTAPSIADILVEDKVDIALLSPGWYICHQSVGLIQREIEKRGIRTASIMHLAKVGSKVRPPRILHIVAPLGRTFSNANDLIGQTALVKELLNLSIDSEAEEVRKASFKYKKPFRLNS